MDDLKTFVRYVRDHDVQLAADGVIYKRQLLQLLSLMSVYEEAPDKTGGWRFGYGRKFPDYPDRFSFMYDYACRKKLIQELPDRLLLMEEGRDFADGSHSVDLTDLYRFWLRLYKTPIPNIAAVSQWVARLCTEWTTVVSLFDILKPLIRPYHFDKEMDILRKRILNLMMHLGLLRSGVSANGEDMVRSTEQGKTMVSSMTVSSGGQPI